MNKNYLAANAAANFEWDLRSGAGLNSLGDYVAEEIAAATAGSPWEHRSQRGEWLHLAGLRSAAEHAAAHLAESARVPLPWNLNKGFKGWVQYPSPVAADEEVQRWKRWIGWLLAVGEQSEEYSLLVALIRATQSEKGLGSPRTTCQLQELAEKFRSPGRLERILRATVWQTDRFLRGFGVQFSHKRDMDLLAAVLAPRTERNWDNVSQGYIRSTVRSPHNPARAGKRLAALVVNERLWRMGGLRLTGDALEVLVKARGFVWLRPLRRRGKRDVISWVHPHPREVVAWAVSRVNAGEFASLREALTVSDRLVRDRTDGVECVLDPHAAEEIHGVRVTPGHRLTEDRRGRTRVRPVWLVARGARSFHVHQEEWAPPPAIREAVRQATKAWRAQDAAADLARRDFPHLVRERVTILVTRQDSYHAGNCQPGTESWVAETGIGRGRWAVPASALLPHASDARVARVLAVANVVAARLCV